VKRVFADEAFSLGEVRALGLSIGKRRRKANYALYVNISVEREQQPFLSH
jgi:hypothetical protein